jgi:hypothetical protein
LQYDPVHRSSPGRCSIKAALEFKQRELDLECVRRITADRQTVGLRSRAPDFYNKSLGEPSLATNSIQGKMENYSGD